MDAVYVFTEQSVRRDERLQLFVRGLQVEGMKLLLDGTAKEHSSVGSAIRRD